MTCYTYTPSPLGPILLAGDDAGLRCISLQAGTNARRPDPAWRASGAPLDAAVRQLAAYFAGELRVFDLRLAPRGTPFQRAVWTALCAIPYGETISYGELARRVGDAKAARAVGAANGRNPLPIVVPCHRVIGSDGRLTGFAGGLHLKDALLTLERRAYAGESGTLDLRAPA
jgi:methylated-DNA-[protein]-cysteine S-methyltransferase